MDNRKIAAALTSLAREVLGERKVHLTMGQDPLITKIVRTAFPEYKGRRIELIEESGKVDLTSYWSGGSITKHVFVNIADFRTLRIPQVDPVRGHAPEKEIPPGHVLVQEHHFMGKVGPIRVLVPSSNFNQLMLPAPLELTWAEKVVLVARRESHGTLDYKFFATRDTTGITRPEWDAAKLSLVQRGLLNKAEVLTTNGKNAVETITGGGFGPHLEKLKRSAA